MEEKADVSSVAPKKLSVGSESVQGAPSPSIAPKKLSIGGQSVQGGPAPSIAPKKLSLGGQSVQGGPTPSIAPKKLSIGGQSVQGGPTPSVAPKKLSIGGQSVQGGPTPSVAPKKLSIGGQSVQGGPTPSVAPKKLSIGGQSVQGGPTPSVAPKKLSIGGQSVQGGPTPSVAPKKLSIGGQSVQGGPTPSVAPKKSSLGGQSVQGGPTPSIAPKKLSIGGQSVQGGPAPSIAPKKSSIGGQSGQSGPPPSIAPKKLSIGGQSVQSAPPPSIAPKKLSIGGQSVQSGVSGAPPPSIAPKKLPVGGQSVQGGPAPSIASKKLPVGKKNAASEGAAGETAGEETGAEEDGEADWEFEEDATEYDAEEEEEGDEDEEEEEVAHHPVVEEDDEELTGIEAVKIARDNILTFANVAELGNLLSKVKLVWPEDLVGYNEKAYISDPSRQGLRRSYYTCSGKEKAVLWHAENFRKQFQYHCPDRRPLYIAPKNQCGIQKLFPTFLSVGCTRYSRLYEPEACVKFFTDFFNPEFLEPATDVPNLIRSHDYVIKHRKANSYEISIIIASLLIGAGYDAYVCDGYACEEFTTLCSATDYVDDFAEPYDYFDEGAPPKTSFNPVKHTRRGRKRKKTLEFGGGDAVDDGEEHEEGVEGEEESEEKKKEELMASVVDSYFNRDDDSIPPVSPSKYKIRGKKQFKSKFEETEAEKAEVKRLEEEAIAIQQAEEEMLKDVVPPAKDKLFGFRIHSWVVVKPKPEDDFEEPFFLEPFTGTKRTKSDPGFIGIEAVFNEKNYWVNIQGCTESCAGLSFDLEEKEKWAQFLVEPAAFKELRKPKPKPEKDIHEDDEEEEQIIYPPMYLDMPVTWTKDLNITESDYLTKYPGGKKTYQHNDAVVERSSAYANPDGMIRKVLKFKGNSRKASDLLFIEERFEKRTDKLDMRKWYKKGRILHEYFEKGRHDALKEHIHVAGKNQPHHPRHLYYYSNAHPENASHRQVVDKGLIEHFENRDDFLYYRFTAFGAVLCETVPEKEEKSKTVAVLDYIHGDTRRRRPRRKIIGIIEKYHRNPEKEVRDDISEKYILIDEGRFRIVFHYGDEDYTRATLEFFKAAAKSQVMKAAIDFKPEDSVEYRVDPFTMEMTNFKKYQFLKQLKTDQVVSSEKVRAAEDEITNTVLDRVQEDWKHELEPKPRALREQEAAAAGKEEEDEKLELDFTAPYLEQYVPRNKEEEMLLKRKIMEDFRERIFRKIETIQKNYAMESALLKELRLQPDNEQDNELDEDGYLSAYEQTLARMQVMEQRILRIREKAPGDYCSLLIQVIQHPLLNRFSEEEKKLRAAEIVQQGIEQMEEARKLELAKRRKSCCTLTYFHKYKEPKLEKPAQEENDRASLYV